MNKLKTSKSICKRFKITSRAKLLRHKASRSHLLRKKASKRKQDLRHTLLVNSSNILNFKNKLPYLF